MVGGDQTPFGLELWESIGNPPAHSPIRSRQGLSQDTNLPPCGPGNGFEPAPSLGIGWTGSKGKPPRSSISADYERVRFGRSFPMDRRKMNPAFQPESDFSFIKFYSFPKGEKDEFPNPDKNDLSAYGGRPDGSTLPA